MIVIEAYSRLISEASDFVGEIYQKFRGKRIVLTGSEMRMMMKAVDHGHNSLVLKASEILSKRGIDKWTHISFNSKTRELTYS